MERLNIINKSTDKMERKNMEEKKLEYSCGKCKNQTYEEGKISTTGSGLSKFLNMQSNNFTTISCTKCGYTEIFKGKKSGALSSIFDVLTN